MHPLIEGHRAEIAELGRRYQVCRLDVFGSAAREDFDPSHGDVDHLVEFEANSNLKALEQYFGLKGALEALLGRTVDLIVSDAVRNPYLRAHIDRSRESLFAA